jgi:hypothetical protein
MSESTTDGITTDGTGTWTLTARAVDSRDWVLSNQTIDADGDVAAPPAAFTDCLPPPPGRVEPGGTMEAHPAPGTIDSCFDELADAGYKQRLVYQPHQHFWPLQWAETGLYVAASGVLAGLSFWWIRRRRTRCGHRPASDTPVRTNV